MSIRYDSALPVMVNLLTEMVGRDFVLRNLIFRDADGLLSLILREPVDADLLDRLNDHLNRQLEGYAGRPVIIEMDSVYDQSLLDPNNDDLELVHSSAMESFYIRFQEKRIVGNDWSRGMQTPLRGVPPIFVFSSLKGGVGRSTALAVTAKSLSQRGIKVLAVDLDLEAPGIGGMLISKEGLPQFGTIDYYVEFGRSMLDNDFMRQMCVAIPGKRGGGITVVPAVGLSVYNYPENVLGKISRAYLESTNEHQEVFTFSDKTRQMIRDLAALGDYDVIFIDARAGLNESTAATIQGLGADVLFFGIDTPQTWDGYRYFFSHMARYKNRTSEEDDWRYRIRMIHSKAGAEEDANSKFRDSAFELFASFLYDEIDGDELASGLPRAFSFDLNDVTAPHYAWAIPMSSDYYEFNPLIDKTQFDSSKIEPVFSDFINGLKQVARLQ